MLLEFYHFRDGKAYFEFSIYGFILSDIDVKTDEIYPIMKGRFERKDIEDISKYILAITTDKKIGFLDTNDIFNSSITLLYKLNYFIKIQTKSTIITTIRGETTETSPVFARRFNIQKNKDKYEF